METRFRSRDLRQQQFGSYYDHSGWPVITVTRDRIHGVQETCDDVVGNREDVNPLQISKVTTHYPALNGIQYWIDGSKLREFVDFPIGYRPGPVDPRSRFPGYDFQSLQALAWKILAETNPSAPHVSIPSFIGEMKDIPDLVKGYGETLLKSAAAGYLSWRWAVKPMIGDLRKMMQFTKACNQRFQELLNLRDGRTMRRRCHLGQYKDVDPRHYVTLHSEGAGINGWTQMTYTAEVWGTVQYKVAPDSQIPNMGYGELDKLARRLTLGLTSHEALATAWELTPWSWFIDWFSSVGDVIAATNNTIGLSWSKISLMRRSKSVRSYEINPSDSAQWCQPDSWYIEEFERKERHKVFPVLPVPLPCLPVIDDGKFAILASLAALKR